MNTRLPASSNETNFINNEYAITSTNLMVYVNMDNEERRLIRYFYVSVTSDNSRCRVLPKLDYTTSYRTVSNKLNPFRDHSSLETTNEPSNTKQACSPR